MNDDNTAIIDSDVFKIDNCLFTVLFDVDGKSAVMGEKIAPSGVSTFSSQFIMSSDSRQIDAYRIFTNE